MRILKLIEEKIQLWLIASFTLGLAPFAPEPHLWGKLKWVAGGAVGMKGPDWFDLFMHGTPWLLLIIALLLKGMGLLTKKAQ
jgi:hypothetical protein